MKKILVTGGTGFIGSHLVEMCLKKNFNVTCFDRYNPNYYLNNLENSAYKKNINFIFGDVRDFDSVNKAIKGHDYVFHLAALGSIPYSYYSPLAYIKTNVEGTYNVLESCRINKIKEVVTTSTSEVYGTAQKVPISENHPLVGQSPYAASKIAADQLSISYYRSYNYNVKIIRPFNVYGPRQSMRAIIPTIINQGLYNKTKNILLGNIDTKRDFTFVSDLCEAYFKLLSIKRKFGQPFNIGTGKDYYIKEIVKMITSNLNSNLGIQIQKNRKRPKNSEVYRLVCDSKNFQSLTKWKPKISINEGLKKTIDWYKSNKNNYSDIYQI